MPSHTTHRKVAFVAIPELHALDLSGPLQIFSEAIDVGEPYELLHVSSQQETHLQSSSGLSFGNLVSFSEVQLQAGDMIFIPGMRFSKTRDPELQVSLLPFFTWLQNQHRAGVILCSVGLGAFVLASSGLLNGQECTTHWRFRQEFSERFPNVSVLPNRLLVQDGGFYSSAGESAGIDLALYLIEMQAGPIVAADVAQEASVYPRRERNDPPLSAFLKYLNHQDTRIHSIQRHVHHHLAEKLDLEDMADEMETTDRNLRTYFKKIMGLTVLDYQQTMRKAFAKYLMGRGTDDAVIAQRCGYASVKQLKKALEPIS